MALMPESSNPDTAFSLSLYGFKKNVFDAQTPQMCFPHSRCLEPDALERGEVERIQGISLNMP
jgi:hypothetical protein